MRGRPASRGWSVVEGWALGQKNSHFLVLKMMFGCILTPFLTGRKHGQWLEALGRGFYASIAKRSLQKQDKNYPKIHSQTGGGAVAPSRPREYATAYTTDIRQWLKNRKSLGSSFFRLPLWSLRVVFLKISNAYFLSYFCWLAVILCAKLRLHLSFIDENRAQ